MQHIGKALMSLHTSKRTPSRVAFATGLLTVFLLVGCSMEDSNVEGSSAEDSNAEDSSDDGPGLGGWEVEEPSATSGDTTAEEASTASSADEVIIQASCSIVEWCNIEGPEGARCKQQGCSLQAALNECTVETWRVCGTPKCEWRFVALNGQSWYRSPCPGPRP
ncbi:MAG TPA: hypothetical protein VNM90_22695 [Haliangium sp.]|nr:hypothetical protein [Haliangium sp.]